MLKTYTEAELAHMLMDDLEDHMDAIDKYTQQVWNIHQEKRDPDFNADDEYPLESKNG